MRITDYESARSLRDVSIALTRNEAEELANVLQRLLSQPDLGKVHLSEVQATHLERELTIAVV